MNPGQLLFKSLLGGGFKYFYFYPDPWGIDANFKGCFSTPLEHTPKPLPRGYNGNSLHRLPGVGCSRGVLNFFLQK